MKCLCHQMMSNSLALALELKRQGNEGGHLNNCPANPHPRDASEEDPSLLIGNPLDGVRKAEHFRGERIVGAAAAVEDPSALADMPCVSASRAELESLARYFCGLLPRLTDLPVADQRQYEAACRQLLALAPPERAEKVQPLFDDDETETVPVTVDMGPPPAAKPKCLYREEMLFGASKIEVTHRLKGAEVESAEPTSHADALEPALKRMEMIAKINKIYLDVYPDTPALRDARIRYRVGAHDPEVIAGINRVLELGAADVESLVAWRVAELRKCGVNAKPHLTAEQRRGTVAYRAWVQHPDGSLEDPEHLVVRGPLANVEEAEVRAVFDGTFVTKPQQIVSKHRCGHYPEFEVRDGFWALFCDRCKEWAS